MLRAIPANNPSGNRTAPTFVSLSLRQPRPFARGLTLFGFPDVRLAGVPTARVVAAAPR
jgi:hypothetical protein